MSELDDFVATVIPRQVEAETALHNGDAGPRLAMWSARDPVTLLGADSPRNSGRAEVERISRWIASRFSGGRDYELEVIAAGVSGDLAYVVGYERSLASLDGGPLRPNVVRATHVYRREDGEWKIVHRHGDFPPADKSRAD
jgi:ketosteroid isomerase-like protein